MGHLAIFSRITGLKKMITSTVLKISKSVTFAQKFIYKIPQEI